MTSMSRCGAGGSKQTSRARRLMVVAVAALAVAIVAPSIASAAEGNWKGYGYLPITESTSTPWSGKVKVVDPKTIINLKLSVECADTTAGSATINGKGEITSLTTSGCSGSENCAKEGANLRIAPINLPWKTELALSGTFIDRVANGGKGTPGFELECKALGLPVIVKCTGNFNLGFTKLEGVVGTFNDPYAEKTPLTCTESEASGTVSGEQKVSGVEGVEETPPLWTKGLNGPPLGTENTVEWSKGTITLMGGKFGVGGVNTFNVSCEEAGKGSVGAEGVGSIGTVTLSNCHAGPESECKGDYSLEAMHLPWSTSLFFGGNEKISDAIASSGAGTPGFKLRCLVNGSVVEVECVAGESSKNRLAAKLANTTGGVSAEYYDQYNTVEATHLKCNVGGGSESSELRESSHTLKLSGSETILGVEGTG